MGGAIQTVQHQHVKWRSIYLSMIPCLPSSPMFTFCLSHSAVQRIWGWWNSYCRLYHVNCPWWTSWASSEVHTTPLVLFYLHTYLSPNLPIHHTLLDHNIFPYCTPHLPHPSHLPLTTSSHTAPLTYRTPPTSHSQHLPILHPSLTAPLPPPTHNIFPYCTPHLLHPSHLPLTTSSHTAPLTYRTPPTSHSQHLPILQPSLTTPLPPPTHNTFPYCTPHLLHPSHSHSHLTTLRLH